MRQPALLLGLLWLTQPLYAAPLFPSREENHWAHQAMRRLAQQGLTEGYPDGSFKGDRAASRYEVATILARLLAREERIHSTLASQEQRQLVHQLARELSQELSALGVRVTHLEEQVAQLEPRVKELERITLYGSFESRVVTQTFANRGNPDNDNQRGGLGTKGVPFLNYNQIVGAGPGATLRPQVNGVIPVVDYRNGRSLVSGVGFTALLRLGLKAQLGDDSEAGVEFAGFSSQGNQNVDAYFGVNGPYLANPWTLNQVAGGGLQGQNNSPFSRVVFDHAWYEHKPSKTRVILGAFDNLRMDPFVYAGQGGINNLYSSGRFPGFGIQVHGGLEVGPDQELVYEIFGSRFGDGGNVFSSTNYTHTVLGGDLKYRNGTADVKLNWARYYDESPDLSGPLTGLENVTNVAYLNSAGWSQTQWVNPPGNFAFQRSAEEIRNTTLVSGQAYVPNQVDTRPVAAWNGQADNSLGITGGAGNFGPQSQNSYGLSAHYWIPLSEGKDGLKLTGEYGHSDYKSNRNSGYVARGNMARLDLSAVLLEGDLNLGLQGLHVDPTYNPALFNASLLGIRFVRPYNFLGRFHLYDNANYPQNREGLGFKGTYTWDYQHFSLGWKGAFYRQTRTSLYDVRVLGGALGASIPTNDVLGFSPGFIDPVFSGFAHPNLYGPLSGNSFTSSLEPLENPRGSVSELGLYFKYKLDEPRLGLELNLERNHYLRTSALAPAQGGSQNQVDLKTDYAHLGLSWGFQENWTVRSGLELVHALGHHDPGGLYNGFALSSGQTNFRNIDSIQTIPYVGFDQQLSKTTSWGLEARFYNTRDRVDPAVFAGSSLASIGATANPFNWSGPQVSSYYKMTF